MAKTLIGIIGSGQPSAEGYRMAMETGHVLAGEGLDIICGGMAGVMEAASRGCSDGGGTVIGLLPTDQRTAGNAFLTYALPTNLGHARNVLIAHAADVLIAIEGEYGTLSEIAVALKLGRPVIGLKSNWDIPGVIVVESPQEAVKEVLCRLEDNV